MSLTSKFHVDKDFTTSGIQVKSDIRETEINIPAGGKDKVRSISDAVLTKLVPNVS